MPGTGVRLRIPEALLEAASNRRLVPFIGAGFSKNISPDIPDASCLIEIAARTTGIDPRLLRIHSDNDYMIAAEYLELAGTLNDAVADLNRLIHDGKYSVEASRPHIQLTEIQCTTIFTTNWDHWIERAFEKTGVSLHTVREAADLLAASHTLSCPSYPDASTTLIKYHGDINHQGSIVFSIRSYFDRILERSPLDTVFEAESLSKSLLFIGYSFSDPNLRLLWYKLLRHRQALASKWRDTEFPKSFLIATGRNPLFVRWLARLGIQVIDVDPTPAKLKDSIEQLLDAVIGAQRRA